jgi:hypothetical protein
MLTALTVTHATSVNGETERYHETQIHDYKTTQRYIPE